MKRIVHIVGTGTIGEPLIGLFTDFRTDFGIDEVTFHKRTPLASDKARIQHLMGRGAHLVTEPESVAAFEGMGHKVSFEAREALERATVVIDCTPAGNENKKNLYSKISGPQGFLAQGSEFGFGKPFARGVNDEAFVPEDDQYLQIVSCNTHNITTLIKTIADDGEDGYCLDRGTFVCMRRANDITQVDSFLPAPSVGKHGDAEFGTHHARDAFHLFETVDQRFDLFSSAVKLNTQYMHSIWFNLVLDRDTTVEEVVDRLHGESSGGGDRQGARQPDLQLRSRSRLLRSYPVADGGRRSLAAWCATSARSSDSASRHRTETPSSRRWPGRSGA